MQNIDQYQQGRKIEIIVEVLCSQWFKPALILINMFYHYVRLQN